MSIDPLTNLFSLLVLAFVGHADLGPPGEVGELRIEKTVIEREVKKPLPFTLDGVLELRSAQDLRDRPQNGSRQGIHEFSLGGRYAFDEGVGVRVELSLEKLDNQSTFFAKQAYVSYRPLRYADAQIGQQFLPVGLIAPRDNWFAINPPYYQKLFRGAKPIDLGVTVTAHPLADLRPADRDLAYLEFGAFSGHLVRNQDQRVAPPEHAPRTFSLKSRSAWHDAFLTYFDHDLAFYDPVRAGGVGFEVRAPNEWPVRGSLLGEYWDIRQLQGRGPTERTRAFTVYGQVDWWRLKAGYRFGRAAGESFSAAGSERLPLERSHLAMVEARLANVLSLRVERVFARQDEVLADDWVYRALLNVTSL